MSFFKKSVVSTDPQVINEFLTRGVEAVFPSKEAFAKALGSGKQLSIYLGIDPTGPTLHTGHAIPLMKLSALQKMGHKIILLMGDFTAMIGDPTDKGAARKRLTRKEVLANLKQYKKQASTFLKFSGSNAAEFKYNSTWLSKLDFNDVVELAATTTVQQMLERDMFEKRMEEKKPIFLHEFLYPLMQGYDSVAMGVDAEIGGNDQTFNMLAGRNLLRTLKDKEKFVLSTKLLVDASGKKMGKTEGNMITLADTAANMFGKVMSWTDTLILPGYELCTTVSQSVIDGEKMFLEQGGNPRDAKMRLALEMVTLYHGVAAAQKAQESFTNTFSSKGGMPADAPIVSVASGTAVVDVLLAQGLVSSKTDWRRLVGEKAVKDIATGEPVADIDVRAVANLDLKIGKHRFIQIRIK
jgi:tyrosyl-tRNA synthetase